MDVIWKKCINFVIDTSLKVYANDIKDRKLIYYDILGKAFLLNLELETTTFKSNQE